MKACFRLLMALVVILLPMGQAYADGSIEIPIGGSTTSTMQLTIKWDRLDGVSLSTPKWLAMSPYGEAYIEQSGIDPGIYARWDVETTDIMWDGSKAGVNAGTTNTYPMFRLRNAATGKYLKQASEPGISKGNVLGWEYQILSTLDADEAILFALVPKSAFGNEENTYPEGSYVLMTNTMVHEFAACLGGGGLNNAYVPLTTARKYNDWGWDYLNVAVSCTKTETEVVEDLATLYNMLKAVDLANYPKGSAMGQYNPSAVDAFTSALNDPDMLNSITDFDGDRTDVTAWNNITKLHAAYVNMLEGKNKKVLNGYYRIVNTSDAWGEEKAMCWRTEENPTLWWATLDKDDMSQIWRIKYNETTGKYDMVCLDSYYRINTRWNYRGSWGEAMSLERSHDGQMDIEYVEDVCGEEAFYIKSSGQFYHQPEDGSNALGMFFWKPDGQYTSFRVTPQGHTNKWFIREVEDVDIEEKYTLVDGTSYTNNSPIFAEKFHYIRNMKNTSMQSMYVPVALPVETFTDQGVSVYYLNDNHAYFNSNGELESMTMEVVPITSGTLMANTPYVIRASSTGEKDFVASDVVVYPAEEKSIDCSSTTYTFTFTGTNQPVSSDVLRQNEYYFFSGGGLKQIGSATASLGAQRWYMDIDSRGALYSPKPAEVKVVIWGEDTWNETGIESTLETAPESTGYYDLSGRRVNIPTQRGIYIQNGRKVLVR